MEKGFFQNIIRNRRFTLFFTVLALILGAYSYNMIPKQESPNVNAPYALIQVIYPGAAPEDVEKLVTRIIEDKVTEVPGYKTSTSYSRNSISVVVLELYNNADSEKSWAELRRLMDDIQKDLPAECGKIQTSTDLAETPGMILSLSGNEYSYEQLSGFADRYKKELGAIDGISKFQVDGVQKKEVEVTIHAAELNQFAISIEDVLKILQIQNLTIPSGSLNSGDTKVNVSTGGAFSSLADVENTIITGSKKTGALVRLKDIATVAWGLEDSNYKLRENGRDAILLSGYFQENKNILMVGNSVRAKLDALKQQMPPGLHVDEVVYQPQDVQKSVSTFFENLIEGIILVLIVVFLGMGLKNAIVASTAVPLSILLAFAAMYYIDIPINEISIAALIIALGMLVDDAIVIIDSIQVYLDEGLDKMEACVKGTRRAVLPIFSATLTTGAAFAPMLFVPGPAGQFLHSLPFVVILAVFASFLVAVFVTPVLSYIFFSRLKADKARKRAPMRHFYESFLRFGMRRKGLTLTLVALSLVGAVFLGLSLHITFFPKADKNILYVDLTAETAANLDNTAQKAAEVEKLLSQQKEVLSFTTAIGGGLPKFYITVPKASPSQNFAQIMFRVDLKRGGRFKNNQEFAVYLQNMCDENLVGGKATVQLLAKAMPGTPLRVRVSGSDQTKISQAIQLIRKELENIPGTLNVNDDLANAEYEFQISPDHDKEASFGMTAYDVQRQVNIALHGSQASVLRKAGNAYPIRVVSDIHSPAELSNFGIKSSVTGKKALLKEFAQISLQAQIPTIKKYDRERAVTVYSEVKPGFSAVSIEKSLKSILANHSELNGVNLVYEGESKDIKDNFGNLGSSAIFTLFAIYIVLMLQFRSFLQPLIIFVTIPLSLVGVVAGLFIFRQPLSFTALVGVVSLMGIVIKNAILLIGYTNSARAEGLTIEDACFDAVSKRYRPIFLGAMTTLIGLTPLALSGSDLFVPLSISIMSGLLVSTLLTLVVIPIVYSLLIKENIAPDRLIQQPPLSGSL